MNSKREEKCFIIYDGCMQSGEYINENFLPKINGKEVESFWCPCDFTKDSKFVDAAGWKFTDPNVWTKKDTINVFGYLPDSLKHLFGWQVIENKKYFVRHVSFTISKVNSCNFMSIYVENNTLSLYYDRTGKEKTGLSQNTPYVKKLLAEFKKKT